MSRKWVKKVEENVGIPSSVEQLALALTALEMNYIIVSISSTDGVAVYATAWRVTGIAVASLIGISIYLVSVSGAAFGEKTLKKLKVPLSMQLKSVFLSKPQSQLLYTSLPGNCCRLYEAESAARIAPELIRLLKIMTVFYPAVVFESVNSEPENHYSKHFNRTNFLG